MKREKEKEKEIEKPEAPQKQVPVEIPLVTPREIPDKQQEETGQSLPGDSRGEIPHL